MRKNNELKATAERFGDPLSISQPPLHRRLFAHRDNILQMKLGKLDMPNFATEATTQHNVVHSLWRLITHVEDVRWLQPMAKPPIPSPPSSMHE